MHTYITATAARKNFFSLIETANKSGKPISITHGGIPKAVLMSQDEFDGLIETLEIMSDPQLMKDIRDSMKDKRKGKPLEQILKGMGV